MKKFLILLSVVLLTSILITSVFPLTTLAEQEIDTISLAERFMFNDESSFTLSLRKTPDIPVVINWTSSNEDVVKVDDQGTITPKAPGTSRVEASYTNENGEEIASTCKVTVPYIWMNVSSITVDKNSSDKTIQLFAGVHGELNVSNITWTSSDSSIAAPSTVIINNGKSNATITYSDITGSTTITAQCGDYYVKCKIYVKDLSDKVLVEVIDVGKGDSTLIIPPSNTSEENRYIALVDAGEKETVRNVINVLEAMNITEIDRLILTHQHEDHIGGVPTLLDAVNVVSIFTPENDSPESYISNNGKSYTKGTGTEYRYILAQTDGATNSFTFKGVQAFTRLRLDTTPGNEVTLTCLSPVVNVTTDSYGYTYSNDNNYSAVLRLQYGDSSMLLMGDAEMVGSNTAGNSPYNGSAEHYLITNVPTLLQSDILRVGHHGIDSTSPSFLDLVNPSDAVISTLRDRTHSTALACMNTIQNKEVSYVYRTNESGDVYYLFDNSNGIDRFFGLPNPSIHEVGAPQNVSVLSTYPSISLNWDPSTPIEGCTVRYRVQRSIDNGVSFTTLDVIDGNSFIDSNVVPMTGYVYRIHAIFNSGSTDTYSSGVTTLEPVTLLPSVPSNFGISSFTSNSATLTWDPIIPIPGFTIKYSIYRLAPDDSTYRYIGRVTSPTYTDTGLQQDSTYSYKIASVIINNDSEEILSDRTNAENITTNPVAVPTDLSTQALSPSSVSLTWSAISEIPGAEIVYSVYYLEPGSSNYTYITRVTDPTFVHESLEPGKTYEYKVAAVVKFDNDENLSERTNAVIITLPPYVPSNFEISSFTSNSATLSWDPINPVPGFTIKYSIYRLAPDDSTYRYIGRVTSPTYTDTGLQQGSTYSYKIASVIINNESNEEMPPSDRSSAESITLEM